MSSRDGGYVHGPLVGLVFENDEATLRDLLGRGVSPNELDSDRRTALIHASIDGKLELARLLLEAGARPDMQDYLGHTALHYAVQNYKPAMASLLLAYGGAVDAEDAGGNTPLGCAVLNSQGRGELIAILLRAGADRHHKNRNGRSPLDIAQSIANYDIRQFFIGA